MIAVNYYAVLFDLFNDHCYGTVIGISFKNVANSDGEITEHGTIYFLDHRFIKFPV